MREKEVEEEEEEKGVWVENKHETRINKVGCEREKKRGKGKEKYTRGKSR